MKHTVGYVPALDPSAGGMYQYSLAMLDGFQILADRDSSLDVIVIGDDVPASRELRARFRVIPIEPSGSRRNIKRTIAQSLSGTSLHLLAEPFIRRQLNNQMNPYVAPIQRPRTRSWLSSCGAEVIIYGAPDRRSFEIGLPYVMPIHDLQHRLQPEFPEVSERGEFERREYIYRNAARTARLLLVDSPIGAEDLLELYAPLGVRPERVKILPFMPPPYLLRRIESPEKDFSGTSGRIEIPEGFLLYPAQFWPHKNHDRLIRALAVLRQENGLTPHLVLTGANSGNLRRRTFKDVMRVARELSVANQITYLGYVPDDLMFDLYRKATGLVFPTFFGPTNIPIVEAWSVGCPVLTSDLRGIREHAGDAAILVDPRSIEALAEGMRRLITDEDLRSRLRAKGEQALSAHTRGDYIASLRDIISAAVAN